MGSRDRKVNDLDKRRLARIYARLTEVERLVSAVRLLNSQTRARLERSKFVLVENDLSIQVENQKRETHL